MPNVTAPLDGVWIIRLPLPFELNHVNVGLVRLDDGYMLIDTGMDTTEAFAELSEGLRSLGVQWVDIRRVLVTHMHPDHVGLLARVLSLSGAELLMHRAEVAHLNMIVDAGEPPWINDGLRLAGTPAQMSSAIHHSLRHLRDALRRVDSAFMLEGGEEISTAIGPARVVWTPGHTVGHVCLYWPGLRLIYAGDLLIEKITPNISWLPERDCLTEYLDSLRSLIPYDIGTVLPSHGEPFGGHRQWIAQTIAHHEARCGQLLAAAQQSPQSAHNLVPVLWDRHLSPFHYHFALFEVLAHLEYLRRQGRMSVEPGPGGTLLWSAVQAASA